MVSKLFNLLKFLNLSIFSHRLCPSAKSGYIKSGRDEDAAESRGGYAESAEYRGITGGTQTVCRGTLFVVDDVEGAQLFANTNNPRDVRGGHVHVVSTRDVIDRCYVHDISHGSGWGILLHPPSPHLLGVI